MAQVIDITGQRFGMLTVVRPIGQRPPKGYVWECRCDCGGVKLISSTNLKRGNSRSCGCQMTNREHKRTHGKAGTPVYKIWVGMVARSHNPKHKDYPRYGGAGIFVWGEWQTDFGSFAAHIGPRPSTEHTVDRIDTRRGYEPGNIRWASPKTQQRNRTNNRLIDFGGELVPVATLAERYSVPVFRLYKRLDRGWDIDRALFEKSRRT